MSVYFISTARYVKIGFSRDPERRFQRLFNSTTRYGAPRDVTFDLASRTLLKVIDGSQNTERLIHAALDDYRVLGEWFIDEPELRDFIDNVQTAKEYAPLVRPAGSFDWNDDPILGADFGTLPSFPFPALGKSA